MWLRWLVHSWVRQHAQQTLTELVAEAVRGEPVRRPQPPRRSSPDDGTSEDEAATMRSEAERPPVSKAFLFALELEAAGFLERLREVRRVRGAAFTAHDGFLGDERVVIAETGVGLQAARQAAAELIDVYGPRWVISAGFAGGLATPVRRGHFVMADTIVAEDGRELSTGLKVPAESLAAQPSLHAGRLVTVDRLVREASDKRDLHQRFGATACDMESWSVAEACRDRKVRFVSVRVISDAVDDVLPREIENLLGQKSLAGKMGAVAGALLNRPSSVKDMWNLYEEAQRGSARLGKFLTGVAQQLGD